MRRVGIAAACVLFLCASYAHAEFYRWIDKDGQESFTNDREQVPQEYRSTATAVTPDEGRVSVGKKTSPTGKPTASVKDHVDNQGRGEEYWRKRSVKLRKEVAVLQDKYDLLEQQERDEEYTSTTSMNKHSGKKKKSDSGLEKRKSAIEKDLNRKKRELEVELPDEARKADAYPGWLRE